MKHGIRTWGAGVAVLGALIVGSAATPAIADEVPIGEYVKVEMTSIPLTKANAIANGYEVRKNSAGTEFIVAPGTPDGDFSHAVALPKKGTVGTNNTAHGTCGDSWVYFNSTTQIRTGYTIFSNKGQPVSQTWNVAVTSPWDAESYSFTGLATWGSQTWKATRNISVEAALGAFKNAVAGGSVLTTSTLCSSGSPTASIRNQ